MEAKTIINVEPPTTKKFEVEYHLSDYLFVVVHDHGVQIMIQKKNGSVQEISLSFEGWAKLFSNLTAVKDYLIQRQAKIQELKKTPRNKEKFEPLLCETIKIDKKVALFLSMFQTSSEQQEQQQQQGEWRVMASLRGFFEKESMICPLKTPAIYLSSKDIDELILLNAKMFLDLKQEKKNHHHGKEDRKKCQICTFVDLGVIVYHQLDLSKKAEADVMQEIHTCVQESALLETAFTSKPIQSAK